MHYYQHHIGDYKSATSHLTNDEDLAYRRLIEMYYDTEQPIPIDLTWVSRRLRISESTIKAILKDFFQLLEDGWHNNRCDNEIDAYSRMVTGAKAGAKARWGGKRNAHPMPTLCPPQTEGNANHEPITMNHEPITKNQEPKTIKPKSMKSTTDSGTGNIVTPKKENNFFDGIPKETVEQYLAVRKAKRAAKVSLIVVNGLQREANKAGISLEQAIEFCVERNWISFNAEWYSNSNQANSQNKFIKHDNELKDYNRANNERLAAKLFGESEKEVIGETIKN